MIADGPTKKETVRQMTGGPLVVTEALLVRARVAAQIVGVAPRTFRKFVAEGLIPAPAMRRNKLVLYSVATLRDWVEDGGTLVGMGSATVFLTDSSTSLSNVRQRRQVLKQLSRYEAGLGDAREAESPTVDSLAVWEGKIPAIDIETAPDVAMGELERSDERARKLSPRGVIMKVNLDEEHWLSFGCGSDISVMVNTSYAYLAEGNTEVAGRLAGHNEIRLSGLLWPEARQRWSETVYVSREAVGNGQIILFATQPNFRAYFHGGERMLLNALLLGPGFGTEQTVEW